jgi:hypothetical protein
VDAAPGAPYLIEQRLQAPEHCRGDRNRRQGRDARLQETLELGRLRLRTKTRCGAMQVAPPFSRSPKASPSATMER